MVTNSSYLTLESEDGVSSSVEQGAAITQAETFAFDLENGVAIDVGDNAGVEDPFPHDC